VDTFLEHARSGEEEKLGEALRTNPLLLNAGDKVDL